MFVIRPSAILFRKKTPLASVIGTRISQGRDQAPLEAELVRHFIFRIMDIEFKNRLLPGFLRVWPGLQVAVDDLPLFVGLLDDLPSGRIAEHENCVKAIHDLAEFLGVAESDAGDAAARRRSPEDAGSDRYIAGSVIKFKNVLVQQAGAGGCRHGAAYGIANGQVRAVVAGHDELEGLIEVHERWRWRRHVVAKESRRLGTLVADGNRHQPSVCAAVNPSRLPLGEDDGGLAAQASAVSRLRPLEHDMAQVAIIGKNALAQRRHRRRHNDLVDSGAAAESVFTDGRDCRRDGQRLERQADEGVVADAGDGQPAQCGWDF
ncbi:MAG: hypothetical protein BWX73_01715 [Lentisphaerae bacterium ADurb.Bin082]|nr:MAG: hypothetical protein BWX73_01715 [Lentisphaerae bacterium ADurb.Bin082]